MKKSIAALAALTVLAFVATGLGGPPASAAPTHSVSGTLTVPCTKAAGPGLWVNAKQNGVEVAAVSASPTTGAYTLPALSPGTYTVSPAAPGGCGSVPKDRTVTIGDSDVTGVDFTVVNVADISGTVTGCPGAKGAPAKGVTMRLHADAAVIGQTTTNARGFYFFQWLPQKDGYQVEVVAGQGCKADPAKRSVNLTGGDVSNVDFTLTRSRCGTGSLDFGSLGSSGRC